MVFETLLIRARYTNLDVIKNDIKYWGNQLNDEDMKEYILNISIKHCRKFWRDNEQAECFIETHGKLTYYYNTYVLNINIEPTNENPKKT